jgi:hypothetical protein
LLKSYFYFKKLFKRLFILKAHLQNATLAGVAVVAVADMNIRPVGAMIIGSLGSVGGTQTSS